MPSYTDVPPFYFFASVLSLAAALMDPGSYTLWTIWTLMTFQFACKLHSIPLVVTGLLPLVTTKVDAASTMVVGAYVSFYLAYELEPLEPSAKAPAQVTPSRQVANPIQEVQDAQDAQDTA
mgnify:CR=1 FL=1